MAKLRTNAKTTNSENNAKNTIPTLFISVQQVITKGNSKIYLTLSGDFEYHYYASREYISSENKSIIASNDLREDLKIVLKYIYENWSSLISEKYTYVIINESFINYHFKGYNFKLLNYVLSKDIQYFVNGYNMPEAKKAEEPKKEFNLDAYF